VASDCACISDLYLNQIAPDAVVALGEVLWDVFPDSMRLGGAPLNFAVHARRLGHPVYLVSAVGADELGRETLRRIASLDLDTAFVQTSESLPTGTATVELLDGDRASFSIQRPASYDAIQLSDEDFKQLKSKRPHWVYFGTVFASTREGGAIQERLLNELDEALMFYDVNLRPSADSPELVKHLLERADVVKLNEEELLRASAFTGLPSSIERFCREGALHYGWRAVAVTLGSRGCALWVNGVYVEEEGRPVHVADTVGAGDAFAAAFMHGLSSNVPVREIASFANRLGALVASRHGAIPDWTVDEAVKL
jgi:fructokinase